MKKITAARSIGCDLKSDLYEILLAIGFKDVGNGKLIGTIENGDIAICGTCHDGFISVENYETNELSKRQLLDIEDRLSGQQFNDFKDYIMDDRSEPYYVGNFKDMDDLISFIIM